MSLIQRDNKVAMAKGTTWGTSVEPTGTAGVYVKAHTPPKGARKLITNEDEFGRGMASEGQILEHEAQSGSMSMRCYWEGVEPFIASLMGIYNGAEVAVSTGVYGHTSELDTTMDSVFHSIAWDEGDEVKAVNSAKIISGTFSYQDGLSLDVNYMGDKVEVKDAWTKPLNVDFASEGKGIFKLGGATVKINDESGAALADGDKLFPSGIDIAVTRGFEALPIIAGSDTIAEPVEKTAPVVEVTLTFPKKETETAAFLTAFNDRKYKKMSITFDGGAIGATGYNYEFRFDFPKLMIMEAPDFAQDTPLPTTIKLKALKASAAPNGMTKTVPSIYIQNEVTPLSNYPNS